MKQMKIFSVLMKKQLTEYAAALTVNMRGGKTAKSASLSGALLVIVLIFIGAGCSLFAMMLKLCEPLCTAGYERLYFIFGGILAFSFGVFGSVFAAKAQLYDARDNELLLSLPIKPWLLILTRMSGLYLMQLLFCLVVLLPNALAYIIFIGATPAFLVNLILMLIFFPALTLSFVCLLARMAALIPARGANKSLLAAAGATIFIILYLYVYLQLPALLQSFVDNAESLFSAGRLLFVFDWFAGALTGNYIDALLFILLSVLLLAVVTRLLAAGFLRTALKCNDTARTAKPTRGSYSRRRLGSALFMRELTHLINCAPYMINCALGSVMLLAASVFALIKLDDARAILEPLETLGISPLLITAGIIMFILSMNILTAPSISLEGKGIGQLKALPLRAFDIVAAKLKLHYVITLPPLVIGLAAATAVLRPNIAEASVMIFAMLSYAVLCGLFGMILSLKLPNFNWVNETVAVKQGLSTMLAIFGQWGLILLSWLLYSLLYNIAGDAVTILILALIYSSASAILIYYMYKKSETIFYQY